MRKKLGSNIRIASLMVSGFTDVHCHDEIIRWVLFYVIFGEKKLD